jgi:hypothetical protein
VSQGGPGHLGALLSERLPAIASRAQRLGQRVDPLAAVAAVALGLGTAQLIAGALATGVTVDEPSNLDWMAAWLDDGSFAPEGLEYVYGPAYQALAHGANVLAGNDSLGEVSHSAGAYDVRHLTVAALALLTVAAVGGAVWRLSGSRRFALWSAAGLLAVPAWTGHAFFNAKDIPAACGYTLVTVALILALSENPGHRPGSRYRLVIAATLAVGIFIGAGTRLALWVPFAASLATYGALRLGQRRFGGITRGAGADLALLAGVGAGLGAIAILYPAAASKPFALLSESASGSSDVGGPGRTLTAGQLVTEHPPWWYLPTWIGASIPLLLGAFAVLGAVLGIRALATARGTRDHGTVWNRPELGLLLVLQQALLLSIGAVVVGATMYDGMRQHLYVLPAIAILAGVGAERLWRLARTRRPERRWRALTATLLGAALLVPMAEQTLLFPYNYAYVNPVAAGLGGVNERWESDYWLASAPEALSRTPRTSPLLCQFLPPPDGAALHECSSDMFEPFMTRRGDAVEERWRGDASAIWVVSVKRAGNRPPGYCEEVDNVTRWLRGEKVTMSYVLRCDPAKAQRHVAEPE